MKHSVLIIDDEKPQAEGLMRFLQKERPNFYVNAAYQEEEIERKIEEIYFNIAVVDLRMDEYKFDGLDIIERIIENNPFSKIIVVTAHLSLFESRVNEIFRSGKIAGVITKNRAALFDKEVLETIDKIVENAENNSILRQKTLETLYGEAKNEVDSYQKGVKFENFTTVLFAQMGFVHITKRVKDKSLNEVDLVVRNEISDIFFQKFKPYILIECKNTSEKVDKNNFVLFYKKLKETNGLANLGFLITSNSFTWNTYIEASRTSHDNCKVIFITQKEIYRLIYSISILDEMKSIIDNQVKDN